MMGLSSNPFFSGSVPLCAILVITFRDIPGGNGGKITFYQDSAGRGASKTVDITGAGCHTFEHEWNDKISSLHTQGHCIIAWEHSHCRGKSERIAPGTASHGDLAGINFNDAISSFKLCSGGGTNPTSGPVVADDDLKRVVVEEHNKYRRRHGVPDMRGDEELHRAAQSWADYLASHNKFEHSKGYENLWKGGAPSKAEAVRQAVGLSWYNEVLKYDYNNPGFRPGTGHFTAMIWRKTTNVGIGVAWDPKDKQYVVAASYSPAGNVAGQFPENIPRPI